MSDPIALRCQACAQPMARVLEIAESPEGPRIDVYECPDEGCRRKVDIIYEPAGGLTDEQKTWVEREVARTGAFFPADYGGRRRLGGR